MATTSACPQYASRTVLLDFSRTTSGSVIPVTMPSLAERNWTRPAITFAATITQTSRYPNCAPALTLEATLPGST